MQICDLNIMFKISTAIVAVLMAVSLAAGFQCDNPNPERKLEEQLKKSLFCEYDTNNRPVKNHKDTLDVTLTVHVEHLASGHGTWVDQYLKWNNEDKYKNISAILVPSSKLWIPNIMLVHSETAQSTRNMDATCYVGKIGVVTCLAWVTYETGCLTNYRRWPYDSMNCTLKFKAWMSTGEIVNLTMAKTSSLMFNDDLFNQVNSRNHYWKMVAGNAVFHSLAIPDINITIPSVSFSYVLERHTATWAALIIGPILVMIAMTLTTYILEIGSAERISILGIGFICHFVYMMELAWYIPASGNTCPLVVLFLRGSIILDIVATFETLLLRFVEGCTSDSVDIVTRLLATPTGRLVTFRGFQKMESEFDKTDKNATNNRDWRIFAVILNRLFFLIAFLTYFGMFIAMIV